MEVVNQNNIIEVINSSLEVSEAITKRVAAAVASIANDKNTKALNNNAKTLKTISNIVKQYTLMTSDVITTFCTGLPVKDGKNLSDLLGRIEEPDAKDKNKKNVKYTVVEAVQQVSTLIEETIKNVETISHHKFGLGTARQIKKNIRILAGAMGGVMREFVMTLTDLSNTPGVQDMIKTLVKQPDITKEVVDKKYDTAGNLIEDITSTDKQGGQLGLIDVITQSFSLISTLNKLEAPGFIQLRIQMIKMKLALNAVVGMLINFSKSQASPENLKAIENLSILIGGNESQKDGVNQGLFKISQKMCMLFESLNEWKFSEKKFKSVNSAVNNVQKIVKTLVEFVMSKEAEEIKRKNFGENIQKINNNLSIVYDMLATIKSMIGPALVIKLFGWLIRSSVKTIIKIVKRLNELTLDGNKVDNNLQETLNITLEVFTTLRDVMKITSSMVKYSIFITLFSWAINGAIKAIIKVVTKLSDLKDTEINAAIDKIKSLQDIFKSLRSIMINATLMILLFIPAIVGLICAAIFIVALAGFCWLLNWVFKAVTTAVEGVQQGLKSIRNVFLTLALICGIIVVFALLSPLILEIIVENLVPFIIVLLVTILFMWVIFWVMKKISQQAAKDLRQTAWNILIIVGIFVVIGLLFLYAGWLGEYIMENEYIWYIICTLGAIIAFLTAVVYLAKLLETHAKNLISIKSTILPLMAVIGLLITAGISLIAFAYIGKMLYDMGDAVGYILLGVTAATVFTVAAAGLGMLLSKMAGKLLKTTATILPLLAVLGLLLICGGSLFLFGLMGAQMKEGDTLENIAIGVGVVSGFALIVGVLGLLLSMMLPGTLAMLATIGIFTLAVVVLLGVSFALLEIGENAIVYDEKDIKGHLRNFVDGVADLGWEISGLGFELVIISVGALLTLTFIWPLMNAIDAVKLAAASIMEMGKMEINIESAKKAMNCITDFYSEYKRFVKKFTISDIIWIAMTSGTVHRVSGCVTAIENIAVRLNTIQEIDLKGDSLKQKVKDMLQLTKDIQSLTNDLLGGGGNWFTRWRRALKAAAEANSAKEKIDRVNAIVSTLYSVAEELTYIEDISLDRHAIFDNISFLFEFVSVLQEHITNELEKTTAFDDNVIGWEYESTGWFSGYWKPIYAENATVKKLSKVDQVVSCLRTVTESLKGIQTLYINKEKIFAKTKEIFEFIEMLAQHIEKCLENTKIFEDKVTIVPHYEEESSWFGFSSSTSVWYETIVEPNPALGTMNNVALVTNTLLTICKTVSELKNIKISPEDKTLIKENVKLMFEFITDVSREIEDLFNTKVKGVVGGDVVADLGGFFGIGSASVMTTQAELDRVARAKYLNSDDFKNAAERLGIFGDVIDTLGTVLNSITTIKDFRLKPNDEEIIFYNIRALFDVSQRISDEVKKQINGLNGSFTGDDLAPFTEGLQQLSTAYENLGNQDVSKFVKSTDAYGKFLGKVNSVNIEKAKATTDLLKQMTELSNSLGGNFEKLAEALTEDLLPVLEKLKQVMSDIPKVMEEGFSNTSASIGAINSAPTADNISAQVKRENPNMSKNDVDKLVEKRIKESAKAAANGVVSKLDELLSLLRGCGEVGVISVV